MIEISSLWMLTIMSFLLIVKFLKVSTLSLFFLKLYSKWDSRLFSFASMSLIKRFGDLSFVPAHTAKGQFSPKSRRFTRQSTPRQPLLRTLASKCQCSSVAERQAVCSKGCCGSVDWTATQCCWCFGQWLLDRSRFSWSDRLSWRSSPEGQRLGSRPG